MDIAKSGLQPKESGGLWILKALTGVLVIVILFIHFVVNHILGTNALLTYQDIVRYYSIPIVPIMEMAFVTLVVSHALIGLRGIILDLKPSQRLVRVMDVVFIVVGAGAVVYGIWLISVIVSKGTGG